MGDQSKTLETIVCDWIAAVVSSREGWEVKRGIYRKGICDLDALVSWLDKSFASSGQLPAYQTMKQRWKGLPWPTKPLAEEFATIMLDEAYRRYDLIKHVRSLDTLLADGSTKVAYDQAINFGATVAKSGLTAFGIDMSDPTLYEEEDTLELVLDSWGPVMSERAVKPADLVLLTARTGIGKSWLLLMAAIDGVQQGWDVVLYSLEMPAKQVAKRMHKLLKQPVPHWLRHQPGSLFTVDQTMSRRGFNAGDLLRRVDKDSKTLVIVDYGELLRPESGGRATEGWQKSAEISQSLQNAAKHLNVPVISAVQDNRQALVGKPGTESISGSDQWGRDADTVLRLRDDTDDTTVPSDTRVLECVKSRHTGARLVTFLHFDPDDSGIRVVDRQEYVAINGRS